MTMAQMLPSSPPADVQGKRAERALYDALRHGLSDDYFVYHGLEYLEGQRAEEGEVDFLIVHREKGLLVLECKGGGVRRNPNGAWVRTRPDGREQPMGNPFDQAQKQVKGLVRELEQRMAGSFPARFPFVHGHAVAFPFLRLSDGGLPLDARQETLFTADDMRSVGPWVERALAFWHRAAPPLEPLSLSDFARFRRQVLHPELRLVETLGARLAVEGAAIERLTGEQIEVLKGCLGNRRLRVVGGAGSGKTALAIEAARRFAGRPDQRVLLVCFNKALGAFLSSVFAVQDAATGTVDVLTFHALCRRAIEALGRPYEPPPAADTERARQFWDRDAPAALLDALAAEKVPRYDAIVVDEAQDFHADWGAVLEECLSDRANGSLVVFYDPGQKIFDRKSGLSEMPASHSLSVNFRNTKEIARVVGQLGGVEMSPHARAPIGDVPVIHAFAGPTKTLAQVDDLVKRLLQQNDLRPEQIAVLTPHRREHSSLKDATTLGGVLLADVPGDRAGKVLHTTIGAFKGLESDVVILLDIDPADARCDRRARYVAASRARLALHVFAKGDWLAA